MKTTKPDTIATYQAPNGAIEFRGDYEKETIWGTQRQIAEIFGVGRSVIVVLPLYPSTFLPAF